MEWRAEPGAGYLVERSPDPGTARRGWTRLTSTCDASSGIRSTEAMDEDGTTYTAMVLTDIYGGLQLGSAYAYRVTVVRPDGTSGSAEAGYTTSGGAFEIGPTAAVHSGPSGSTVSLAAGISYCSAYTPPLRCDPWMMEFTVTGSSTGFDYSSRQPWTNNYDPSLPATAPGGVDGTFSFTLPAPPGTHTFTLTALYQPDFRVDAGSVTVVVPPLPPTSGSAAGLPGTPSALPSSRVIMLTGVQAVSAFILPASRSVDLGNWSATGSPRAP